MKFRSDLIAGLLNNEGDVIGQLVRRIAPTEKIIVAVGLGAKETGVPLRFLAYLVPVFRLVQQLPKHTVVEIYIALEGVLRANNVYSPAQVRDNTTLMANLIRRYAQMIYPNQTIKILFDQALSPNAEQWVRQAAEALWPTVAPEVRNFCDKRGGLTAFQYMVEHALYMRDPIQDVSPDLWLVPAMEHAFQHIMMIGGPAEKIFYRIRQQLLQVYGHHDIWESHQLFTPIGDPPTYHPQAGELLWTQRQELSANISEVLPLAVANVAREYALRVGKDLLVLLGDFGGCQDFNRINTEARRCLQGNIPADLYDVLQGGWDRLRSF